MREWIVNLYATQMPAKFGHERVNPDALDRLGAAKQRVELAVSLRVTEVLPVGGLVANAGERGFSTIDAAIVGHVAHASSASATFVPVRSQE